MASIWESKNRKPLDLQNYFQTHKTQTPNTTRQTAYLLRPDNHMMASPLIRRLCSTWIVHTSPGPQVVQNLLVFYTHTIPHPRTRHPEELALQSAAMSRQTPGEAGTFGPEAKPGHSKGVEPGSREATDLGARKQPWDRIVGQKIHGLKWSRSSDPHASQQKTISSESLWGRCPATRAPGEPSAQSAGQKCCLPAWGIHC